MQTFAMSSGFSSSYILANSSIIITTMIIIIVVIINIIIDLVYFVFAIVRNMQAVQND